VNDLDDVRMFIMMRNFESYHVTVTRIDFSGSSKPNNFLSAQKFSKQRAASFPGHIASHLNGFAEGNPVLWQRFIHCRASASLKPVF
jgi:hypothetical protein